MDISRKTFFIKISVVLLSFVVIASIVFYMSLPKNVPRFGNLIVGEKAPSFSAISLKGEDIEPGVPHGNFYVYLINASLPPMCLDEECCEEAVYVVKRGGHVIGGRDLKWGGSFGIKLVKDRPLTFNDSLVVVVDGDQVIKLIYKNAKIEHLEKILERFKL